jgi:antitoxin HicB
MSAKRHTFTIELTPAPEGGFRVRVPVLPGCVTYGDTEESAKANAIEAIGAYLGSLVLDEEEIPDEDEEMSKVVWEGRSEAHLFRIPVQEPEYA